MRDAAGVTTARTAHASSHPGVPSRAVVYRAVGYRALAGAVLVLHLALSLFMLFGGLLVWRGLAPMWLQVPLAAWGVITFVCNMTCPLTPLEKWLRRRAGMPVYGTGFVEQYLMPRSVRGRVTRRGNVVVGVGLLVVNLAIYGAMAVTR